MAKYQRKPTLADVARRRNQTIAELLSDWGLESSVGLEDHYAKLRTRCLKEGIEVPAFVVSEAKVEAKPAVKNALVELPKQSEEVPAKKARKGKLTPDEPVASDEHVGVDPVAPAGPEDPA